MSAPGQCRNADTPVRSEARPGPEALRAGVPALPANSAAKSLAAGFSKKPPLPSAAQMRRAFFLLLIAALAGFGWWRYQHLTKPGSTFTPADGPRLDPKDLQILSALDEEYTRLADAVVPSVVSIASSNPRQNAPSNPLELLLGTRSRKAPYSLGSGVIVSKEGHILTNNHVIEGMTKIAVQLTDGREVPARFIGADAATDIAVLQVSVANLTPLPLADSDAVRVGQVVLAIGNPFGLQETVTQGIISARGRRAMNDSDVEFLQTDAAVNEGNSGGPLLNLRGEIVGINTAIFSKTGGNIGISFAVPSNTARRTLESVLAFGRAVRGYLGVELQAMSPELAAQLGAADPRGAIVTAVMAGSPAEAAGLRPGDIIRKIGGRPIVGLNDVRARVAQLAVGAKTEIVVERNGREIAASATIAEAPQTPPVQRGGR